MKLKEMFDLSNKVAVVTGGGGHLGIAMSEALAEAGAVVYIASRDQLKCYEAAELIHKNTGSEVTGIKIDVSSKESIKSCFGRVFKQSGKIDILVNNASFGAKGKIEDITEESWLAGIDGTLNSVFRCSQAVIPFMENTKDGSIINISSMYGMVSPDPSIYGDSGFDNPPNYGAGKAGVIQYTRFAACHLASKGIRVNCVSPGPFPNPKVQENQWFIGNLIKKVPLGRIGSPHELKGAVLFLASPASSFITGVNIPVDGGWTAW